MRLLQSGLIQAEDLARKYQKELHANEIILLAYYIAAINIEETYHDLSQRDYEPFQGIVLTDTFQLAEGNFLENAMSPENGERAKRQKLNDIRVIIGNPPYSAGQTSENDNNKQHKKHLLFVITTNLTFLSDEVLAFCLEYGIFLSTSLDGPEDLHNKNRPRPLKNGYKLTVSGIKKAQLTLGFDKVGALMTTTEASLTRVKEIIDEYLALEIDCVFLRPLSPYGFAIKTKQPPAQAGGLVS